MNRRTALLSLLLILVAALILVAVSGGRKTAGPPAFPPSDPGGSVDPAKPDAGSDPEPKPTNPYAGAIDLTQVTSPHELTLEQLESGLGRYMNEGTGDPAEKLAALLERWQLWTAADTVRYTAADLNGDGTTELVVALNGTDPAGSSKAGALFVIYQVDDRFRVDRSDSQLNSSPARGVALHGTDDLTGDGRLEIVWSNTEAGAHTPTSRVVVTDWTPGHFQELPSQAGTTFMELEIAAPDLLVRGGMIGSVGAGTAQRASTDTYRWKEGAFRLVDRVYDPSEFGYHLLQDGMVAESLGKTAEAEQAFRLAMEPQRTPIQQDEMLPEVGEERFGEAVRAFARATLALSLFQRQQTGQAQAIALAASGPFAGLGQAIGSAADHAQACGHARAFAQEQPELLETLNSLIGYANPRYHPKDLCAA